MLRPRLRTPRQGLARGLASALGHEAATLTTSTTRTSAWRAPAGRATNNMAAAAAAITGRRHFHQVPSLPHDYAEGVPNLMSAGGFTVAWSDYMALMVEKLNALTAGTELEDKDAKTIALMTAREPSQAPIFNYASMAHNNHFFFQGISPETTDMPDVLRSDLEQAFSSVETLRREFVLTASAMFGPGFVWLVKAGPTDYRLLNTYLAGSPYPGAHWRAQASDMNKLGHQGSARGYFSNQRSPPAVRGDVAPGGIDVVPLLCLSTWEHTWLFDWGLGVGGRGGKAAFAEAWWELIDWDMVAQRANMDRPSYKE